VTESRAHFADRLRAARRALGFTQEVMASALGIGVARYAKYEIGRSEAPYQVLIKIAKLTGLSLDYLIGGDGGADTSRVAVPLRQLKEFVEKIPGAAVVYDSSDRFVHCNRLFKETFFKRIPQVLRPGTAQEILLRAWAYSQGHDAARTEQFVRKRLHEHPGDGVAVPVEIGHQCLQIAESRQPDYKLVLVFDITGLRAASP